MSLADDLDTACTTASPEAQVLLATAQTHLDDLQAALLTLDGIDVTIVPPDTNARIKAAYGWVAVLQASSWASVRGTGSDDDDDDGQGGEAELKEGLDHFAEALACDGNSLDVRSASRLRPFRQVQHG